MITWNMIKTQHKKERGDITWYAANMLFITQSKLYYVNIKCTYQKCLLIITYIIVGPIWWANLWSALSIHWVNIMLIIDMKGGPTLGQPIVHIWLAHTIGPTLGQHSQVWLTMPGPMSVNWSHTLLVQLLAKCWTSIGPMNA
jgi:hypothetical protein